MIYPPVIGSDKNIWYICLIKVKTMAHFLSTYIYGDKTCIMEIRHIYIVSFSTLVHWCLFFTIIGSLFFLLGSLLQICWKYWGNIGGTLFGIIFNSVWSQYIIRRTFRVNNIWGVNGLEASGASRSHFCWPIQLMSNKITISSPRLHMFNWTMQ